MKAITITTQVDVPLERIESLLQYCFDSTYKGVSYYANLIKVIEPKYVEYSGTLTFGCGYNAPLNDGGELWITVPRLPQEGFSIYVLDSGGIERGLQLMCEKSPEYFAQILNEEDTIETADAFLQYCLFGAIVFGKRYERD